MKRRARHGGLPGIGLLVWALAGGCVERVRYDSTRDVGTLEPVPCAVPLAAGDLDATGYASVLGRHLQLDARGFTRVDYGALADSPDDLADLAAWRDQIACARPGDGDLAFWVDAYNATVIGAVLQALDADPGFSVADGDFGFFRGPRHGVAGYAMTLDELEHGVIRADPSRAAADPVLDGFHTRLWGGATPDARLHMVLNCGALSCPNLAASPYTAADMEARLEDATADFLDNAHKGAGPDGISSLFASDWFEADFQASEGSVEAFIANHRPGGLDGVRLARHLPYDWSLNAVD